MFANLVNCSLRGMKGLEVHFMMRGDTQPAFKKARRAPYALQEQVENELGKLVKNGVIKAKPTSHVGLAQLWRQKADSTVRIC